mgnify:CR=1 FL=1
MVIVIAAPAASESTDATTAPVSVESATTIVALTAQANEITSTPVIVERRMSANACGPPSVRFPVTALSSKRRVVPAAFDATLMEPVAPSMTSVTLSAATESQRLAQAIAFVLVTTDPLGGHGEPAEEAASRNNSSRSGNKRNASKKYF